MTSLLVSAKQFGYLRVCVTRGLLVIQTLSVRVIAVICALSLHSGSCLHTHSYGSCLIRIHMQLAIPIPCVSSRHSYIVPNMHSRWFSSRFPAPHQVPRLVLLTLPHLRLSTSPSLRRVLASILVGILMGNVTRGSGSPAKTDR